MSIAELDGVSLYYEEHGEGRPLVLLHGGLGSTEMFSSVLPALSVGRRVVAVDFPAHGRSPDVDRPLRPDLLAGDVAALIDGLGLAPADVMGYSLGGETAFRLAVRQPETVRRLVLVSIPFRRDGSHPEVVAAMDAMPPEAGEGMKASPAYARYVEVAPRPDDWTTMVAKTAELLKVDYDWTAEASKLPAETMLVYADADSVRPDHIVECFRLLGGGLRDAGWDEAHKPVARLAVLPGRTHYDVLESPLLAPAVIAFLEG
jgi:pimeloyl-ACP methyl ester carboxylesterase